MDKQREKQAKQRTHNPTKKEIPKWSHQFCYVEDIILFGVNHKRKDETINKPISNHAKHISKTNTKEPRGHTFFQTFEVDPSCAFNQICTYTFPSTKIRYTNMIYVKNQYLIYHDIFQYIIMLESLSNTHMFIWPNFPILPLILSFWLKYVTTSSTR